MDLAPHVPDCTHREESISDFLIREERDGDTSSRVRDDSGELAEAGLHDLPCGRPGHAPGLDLGDEVFGRGAWEVGLAGNPRARLFAGQVRAGGCDVADRCHLHGIAVVQKPVVARMPVGVDNCHTQRDVPRKGPRRVERDMCRPPRAWFRLRTGGRLAAT